MDILARVTAGQRVRGIRTCERTKEEPSTKGGWKLATVTTIISLLLCSCPLLNNFFIEVELISNVVCQVCRKVIPLYPCMCISSLFQIPFHYRFVQHADRLSI